MTRPVAVVVLVLLAQTSARAETWIGNEEILGRFHAHGAWDTAGAGLSLRQDVVPRVSLSAEVNVVRIDAPGHDDDRHGFAFGGGVIARAVVGRLPNVDLHTHEHFTFELEGGAAVTERFGIGANLRSDHELLAGFRIGFYTADREAPAGDASAIGCHLGFRFGHNGAGGNSVMFLLGYEWGL